MFSFCIIQYQSKLAASIYKQGDQGRVLVRYLLYIFYPPSLRMYMSYPMTFLMLLLYILYTL